MILCYHAVSDDWPELYSVSTAQLRAQVEHLLRRGYSPATFSEIVAGRPRRTFAVTFDDGFRSVPERAFPLLSRLGVPGTLFACSEFVDSAAPLGIGYERWLETPHRDELAAASWQELRDLAAAGWEIGSHTRSHPRLTEIDGESLRRELEESRRELESELGRPCRSLAYPYADVDARVVSAARAAGYSTAATVFGGYDSSDDPLRQPRLVVYRHDTLARFRWKARPAVYGLLTSRPVRVLRGRLSRA